MCFNGNRHNCRIVKLVRALRKGWIKRDRQVAPQEPATYLMWDDDLQTEDKTMAGGSSNCLHRCCRLQYRTMSSYHVLHRTVALY